LKNKPKILVHCYILKRLEDLILFAKSIENQFDILFIIYNSSYKEILNKHRCNYIYVYDYNKNGYIKSTIFKIYSSKILQKQLVKLRKYSIGQYLNEYVYMYRINYNIDIVQEIILNNNIRLCVTLTDMYLNFDNASFIKSAYDLKIPIVVPFLLEWNPESIISMISMIKYSSNYTLNLDSSKYQRNVFKKYKDQTYKQYYFYHAYQYKVLSQLGILSTKPWFNGGGASSLVAVADQYAYNEHVEMGINKNKLKIIGNISYVNLYNSFVNRKQLKKEIIKKYNLKYNRIIIICLTHWWEHGLSDKKTHWDIVHKTISATIKNRDNYSFFITLHPSMDKKNYIFLEKQYNVKIFEERLMSVLPIADIYVVGQSSTVPWAILCGIKTLMITFYKKIYLYDKLDSITYADSEQEIDNKLKYLLTNDIVFKNDWFLLSRDIVFTNKIANNYINEMKKLMHSE